MKLFKPLWYVWGKAANKDIGFFSVRPVSPGHTASPSGAGRIMSARMNYTVFHFDVTNISAATFWYGWWDSNPHRLLHRVLSTVCLPFQHIRIFLFDDLILQDHHLIGVNRQVTFLSCFWEKLRITTLVFYLRLPIAPRFSEENRQDSNLHQLE